MVVVVIKSRVESDVIAGWAGRKGARVREGVYHVTSRFHVRGHVQ